MFESLRRNIANIIAPHTNSMTIGNEFLRNGSQKTMTPDWSQVIMNDRDHYTGYGYAAITKRARAVARVAAEKLKTEVPDDPNSTDIHPYISLIRESLLFSENKFWQDISTYLDLEGVYYLMAIRNPNAQANPTGSGEVGTALQFQLLSPYNIKRIVKEGTLEIGGYRENRRGFQRDIPKEMIIEMRELNPFDEEKAYAMTDAARESSYTLKSSGDYTRHVLRNNVDAPGIITTDVVLPDEKFKNFVTRMKGHVKGEPVFGNGAGAIKWTPMSSDLSKSALKDINEVERQTLFAVTGMSKTVMGIEESGTTRETSNTQKELFTENEIVPRINLILDALNLDYKNRYSKEYKSKKISLGLINPTESDQDVEMKKADNKKKNFELFDQLVSAGYDEDVSAKFVSGEIGVDELGKPTNERRPDPKLQAALLAQDAGAKGQNSVHIHKLPDGVIVDQQSMLQNAIVNVEGNLTAKVVSRIPKLVKNAIDSEEDVITKKDKKESVNELILILTAFYGIITTLQGNETIKDRLAKYGGDAKYILDKIAKDGIKKTAEAVAISHVDTVSADLYKIARDAALQGKSQYEIISEIKTKYSHDITENRAKTVARTETNRAFTMAQYDADRQFIEQNELQSRAFKKYHTRSANPCAFCLSLESQGLIPFDEPFVKKGGQVTAKVDGKDVSFDVTFDNVFAGNLHPNCVLPDTKVIAPNVKKIIQSQYSGDIIKVRTISGRVLSVTPNHIMLTLRGWISAKNLRKTDSIISYSGWDEIGLTDTYPDNKNGIATAEEIFTSLSKTSGVTTTSVPVSTKDLKGDGTFCKGNIDIISTDSLLIDEINPFIRKSFTDHLLKKTRPTSEISLVEKSNLSSMLFALGLSSDGIMSSDSLSSLLSRGDLTVEKFNSLFKVSDYNSRLQKAAFNSNPVGSIEISNLLKTLTGIISSDNISDIEIVSYSGHIYDLSTVSTLYISSGLITSNCSCDYELVIEREKKK